MSICQNELKPADMMERAYLALLATESCCDGRMEMGACVGLVNAMLDDLRGTGFYGYASYNLTSGMHDLVSEAVKMIEEAIPGCLEMPAHARNWYYCGPCFDLVRGLSRLYAALCSMPAGADLWQQFTSGEMEELYPEYREWAASEVGHERVPRGGVRLCVDDCGRPKVAPVERMAIITGGQAARMLGDAG